jgi:hypothetical protein
MPGETYRLPSQGLFYKNGELDPSVVNGEIHIFPMTAYDEIVVRSADKLFSGDAIVEVFNRCIPQVLQPRKLLAKDVDYIFVCLRYVTYGANLPLEYKHTCENAKTHGYEVPLLPIIKQAKQIDPTSVTKQYTVRTSDGKTVKLRPTTIDAMIKLNQNIDHLNDEINIQKLATDVFETLTDGIESVDAITNPVHINEWLRSLSAGDVRLITNQVADVSDWGVRPVHEVQCRDCGEKIQLQFVTNPVSFFS